MCYLSIIWRCVESNIHLALLLLLIVALWFILRGDLF